MGLTPPHYPVDIERGLRNLLQGRVLLKADCAASASQAQVGVQFASPWDGLNIPGTWLFFNYTDLATLVEPSAADTPAGIEHQEDVTITGLTAGALHITLADPTTNAYTTERGAYIRLRDVPSFVSNLQFVAADFVEGGLAEPIDEEFPCICVREIQQRRQPHTNKSSQDSYIYHVRYYEEMDRDYDRLVFKDRVYLFRNLLTEDPTLGGTSYESVVELVGFTNTKGSRNRYGVEIISKNEHRVDWADIQVGALRIEPWDKIND